jgi:hypothetical protein
VADHLWRRRNGWTFQFNVPKAFLNTYGATPFRISLGALPDIPDDEDFEIVPGNRPGVSFANGEPWLRHA